MSYVFLALSPLLLDWTEIVKHAKADKTVVLSAKDVSTDNLGEVATVVMVDDTKVHYVGTITFYGVEKGKTTSVILDLTNLLKKKFSKKLPDKKTYFSIVSRGNVAVKKFEVILIED
jgi:hypothetical protein